MSDQNTVTRAQFLTALEQSEIGRVQKLYHSVPIRPGDPVWISWFHEPFVILGDTLSTFAQAALDLSVVEMKEIWADATRARL